MTGFNNDGKFVPKVPETYTVSYLTTNQEVKKSNLSPAARSKVVNRSGSSYLSSWADTGLGEAIGYGPCYVCRKSPQWKDLYLPCPGIKEGNPCNNTNKTHWYHASCGGQAEISNRAHIRCKRCYSDSHMSYCSFSCSAHAGEFWGTTRVTFRRSLNTVMGLDCYDDFVDDLIVYMSNHRNDSEVKSGW